MSDNHPTSLSADSARRAFDAVASAQRVATVAELNGVLGRALGAMGFTHFLGATAAPGPDGPAVEITFGANHEAWERHYQSRGYAAHDAVLQEMLRSGEPLFWTDLPARREVPLLGRRIIEEAAEFGLRDGFGVPMFNLDGSISTVLMMGDQVDAKDPDVRASAHLLSLYYGSIGRRLRQAEQAPAAPPPLTARQVECLKWARAGKSSTDIGDILGLSPHTVNEYVAGACARLGVRTRAQAIAEAALHGIIDL